MKPLHLRLQAFGPFAAQQEIDFRQLGGKTFFLIHGPTGSGKTSILDGICFALFGDSSGGERDGRQMRSHHADPAMLTEVAFEFALGATRYRVRRIPEQQRKAKRGEGLVKQSAEAELVRLQEDALDAPIAAGWGRVTEEVQKLLGFESRQFRQVIMLPQGKFFEFLKSSSQEREKILQVLFGTELYKRIEDSLKRAADEVAARARDVRTRRETLLQQAGTPTEDALSQRWQEQQEQLAQARGAQQQAEAAATGAEAVLAQARQLAARFDEADAARAALALLEQQEPAWQQQARSVAAARQAAALRPYEAACVEARQLLEREAKTRTQRTQELEAATTAQAGARIELERQRALAPEREALVVRIGELEALRTTVAALDAGRQRQAAASSAAQQGALRLEKAQRSQGDIVGRLATLQKEVQALIAPAAGWDAANLRLQQVQERQRRQQELVGLQQQGQQAADLVQRRAGACASAQAALDQARRARDTALQQWVAEQSGRIAHALVDGQPCPVCGAREHPAPAQAGLDLAGDAALEAAEQAQRQAESALRQAQEQLAHAQRDDAVLQARLEAARAAAGEAIGPEALAAATDAVRQAQAAVRDLSQRQARLPALQQEAQDAAQALAQAQAAAAQASTLAQTTTAEVEQLQAMIPAALATPSSLQAEIDQRAKARVQMETAWRRAETDAQRADQELVRLQALLGESARACEQASAARDRAAQAYAARLQAAGFADEASYRAAVQDDAEIQRLQAAIERFGQDLAAARERRLRAEDATRDLARPDVEGLAQQAQQARRHWMAASQATQALATEVDHTRGFVEALAQFAQEFRELDERHQVLRSMADVAVGNNPQRMSFQRYVLATLLDEVLAATTARLRVMSRGRYEMRRKLEAADARAAGGLDLLVFDQYTGTTRAVSTLSGGESFLASLALALGLSDVVQSYAGGIRLDAIFVDEGFGTLDPEALDFAIRTLKDLQQAGRMVGIISHVGELREWIDARLELTTTQSGSRAAFVL